MATLIKVRSPYIVEVTGTVGDSTKVEIFLWNDPNSVPTDPNYTLEKDIPSSVVAQATYDISPYIREFISHESYSEVVIQTAANVSEYCYCNIKAYNNGVLQTGGGSYTEELICFDGFGYFEEGQNPTVQGALLTEGTYYIKDIGNAGGIYYTTEAGVGTWSVLYTGLSTAGTVTFNLTNTVGYIPYTYAPLTGENVKVEIKLGGVTQYTYFFNPICEPKYTTLNCDFVNRWGVWQRLVFFKASAESFAIDNKEYNLMSQDTDYSITQNRRQVFNVNANESIKCNSGWVPESYKELIKELMLSEVIRIDDKPVILSTKSTTLQKSINDNNINYGLEFKYAYKALNYIV